MAKAAVPTREARSQRLTVVMASFIDYRWAIPQPSPNTSTMAFSGPKDPLGSQQIPNPNLRFLPFLNSPELNPSSFPNLVAEDPLDSTSLTIASPKIPLTEQASSSRQVCSCLCTRRIGPKRHQKFLVSSGCWARVRWSAES